MLGIQIDNVLAKSFVTDNDNIISETIGGWFVDLHGEQNPTFARRRALQTLDNRLQAEVNAWIAGIESICTDLHIDIPISMSQVMPFPSDHVLWKISVLILLQINQSDLSWATVQAVSISDKRTNFLLKSSNFSDWQKDQL
jgi:hypothetical protein